MKNANWSKNSSINSNLNVSGSIFIDMDAKRRKVEQLLSDKRNIEQKIEQIQAECKHSKQVMKQVANESSFTLRHVCESCGKILGWPSEQERKEFFK